MIKVFIYILLSCFKVKAMLAHYNLEAPWLNNLLDFDLHSNKNRRVIC